MGEVKNGRRAVDTWVTVPNAAIGELMIVMNDLDSGGNICLDGKIHVNGDADFGKNDVHLKCGSYTEGFEILPPKIYTDPGHYPECTYYYVVGSTIPTAGGKHQARIYDRYFNDISTALGDSLVDVNPTYDSAAKRFTFVFKDADTDHYFTGANPVFKVDTAAGDRAVVVNFGEFLVGSPPTTADVEIRTPIPDPSITATIINTRFVGGSDDQRLDTKFWTGGWMTFSGNPRFEPEAGVAMIVHNFSQGHAKLTVGTEENPALLYVTHDVDAPTGGSGGVNGDFSLTGALIVLHNWASTGGPSLTYNLGFLDKLPIDDFYNEPGTSGLMVVLEWREVAAD